MPGNDHLLIIELFSGYIHKISGRPHIQPGTDPQAEQGGYDHTGQHLPDIPISLEQVQKGSRPVFNRFQVRQFRWCPLF